MNSWRKARRYVAGLVVCTVLLGFFYAEENWRGKKAWENCKRGLIARGVELNWAKYIPAQVPDDENVFGSVEMLRWFKGGNLAGWKDLCRNLPSSSFPGFKFDTNPARMLVAEVTIGPPGTPAPEGSEALRWDDPSARATAARLLTNAVGPTATAPQSPIALGLMLREPEDIQPARIFLQCRTAPTDKELEQFLPDSIFAVNPDLNYRVLKFEPDGTGSYRVTLPVFARVADFLAWSDGLEPHLAFIRQALQRPFSRIQAYYGNPLTVPAPNFVSVRNLAQIMGARAQCHYLLGQPEEALRELTFMHDLCRRLLEENKPMTLVSAMIDVAVRGLYASQIVDGLGLQAWREPQLAALQDQLKTINLLAPVKQAFELSTVATFHTLDNSPSAGLVQRSVLSAFCPRGWGYQRMVKLVDLDSELVAGLDAANQNIFPGKIESVSRQAQALDHGSPFALTPNLGPPNFTRACFVAARDQTLINQTLIACGLERYRLMHGEYPENLHTLIPQFLDKIPRDVIGGQPPHYRRVADGKFVLYSIGWNGLDNGGVRGRSWPSTEGDWVWPE